MSDAVESINPRSNRMRFNRWLGGERGNVISVIGERTKTETTPNRLSFGVLRLCYNLFAMTTITITPERADTYRAITGDKESTGRTAGEALDALTSQLTDDESGTLVIVQNRKPDRFFDAKQQARLSELVEQREAGTLTPEEASELEELVEVELNGARERAEALLNQIKP